MSHAAVMSICSGVRMRRKQHENMDPPCLPSGYKLLLLVRHHDCDYLATLWAYQLRPYAAKASLNVIVEHVYTFVAAIQRH